MGIYKEMRVESGISNMDKLIDGGIPRGSMVLVSGDYGTGKTTLTLQFITKGIDEHGELGAFVSFVNDREGILSKGEQFDWRLKQRESEGAFTIIALPPDKILERRGEEVIDEITETVRETEVERIGLDGSKELLKIFENEAAFKSGIARLRRELRSLGCTSLLASRPGINIEDIVDGVIILHYNGGLEKTRAMEVKKMRMSDHVDRYCPFEITDEGIVVTGPPPERETPPEKER